MEEIGDVLSSSSTNMDLNQQPIDHIEIEKEPISLRGIRFECKRKIAAKDAIVKRFGNSGYEKVIQDPNPFLMVGTSSGSVIVFILY